MNVRVHQSGTSFPATGRGRVFSAHEKALNLEFEGRAELATLVTDEQMMTVSSLLISAASSAAPADLRLAAIDRDSAFELRAGRVVFDSGLTLVLGASASSPFTGAIDPARGASKGAQLVDGLLSDNLFAAIAAGFGGIGFAPLAVAMRDGPPYPAGIPGADPFVRAAWKIVRPILAGEVEPEEVLDHVFSLVGLGVGFSPSGDDFLVGMLAAGALLGESPTAAAATSRLPDRCAATTLPGATILRQALRGCFPAYLCRFARGVPGLADAGVSGDRHLGADRRTFELVSNAARHGHSSGIDAVTGFGFETRRRT